MVNDFNNFPQEMQVHILSDLDAVSLMRCAMTCKSIYDIVKSTSSLVYTIQLHLDGFKDAASSISYSNLIKTLVRRRQAWLSLENKDPLTHQMQNTCQAYDLVGGVFAQRNSNYLEIFWLPTAGNPKGRTLQRPLGILANSYFAMDPTQDLIVFLEDESSPPSLTVARMIHIYIHTLSTNAVHPLAQQSPLHLAVLPDRIRGNYIEDAVLQIACNKLALAFSAPSRESRLLIWEWTTSELILDTVISPSQSLRPLSFDFTLLDSTYYFTTCHANSGSIWLYKLIRAHTVATRAVHLTTLHLPPTSSGTQILEILCHAGPVEANALSHVQFMMNDDDRLHMFTILYRPAVYGAPWASNSVSLDLFVHQRVFSKYADRACVEGPPLDVPWEEWGPQNTRFIQYASHPASCVHGQHFISPKRIMDNSYGVELTPSVEVFDFSLAAVLFAKGVLEMSLLSSKGKGKSGTLLPPSIFCAGDFPFFADDVETHLPCVMSMLDLKERYTTYMMHADGIIGMNMNSHWRPHLDLYTI